MIPSTLTLPSPAKLNLFLHVNGRLANGYHELQTLFQFVDYSDQMTFERLEGPQIELSSNIHNVPAEDNLVVKAARLLQAHTGSTQGVKIELDKKLPMGGGIGGGSSNAATTLIACNQLWQLQLSNEELASLGLQLGADVPVFVHGKAALAEGVGEKFTEVSPTEPWYLIIRPDVQISTAEIFTDPDLPRNTPKFEPEQLMTNEWKNDCQNIACKRYPQVEKALSWLLEYAPPKMTGTGSCVFAPFRSEHEARQALQKIPNGMEGFVAKGCNRSPLHQTLQSITNC